MRRAAAVLLIAGLGCGKKAPEWPTPTAYVDRAQAWGGEVLAIDAELPLRFDGTAAVYHPRLRAVVLGAEDGQIGNLDPEGFHATWTGPRELSGLCLPEGDSPRAFASIADPDTIVALDLKIRAATPQTWTLTTWLDTDAALSGLTWVPDGHHPWGETRSAGLFYASTTDGVVTVFDVDTNEAESVAPVGHFVAVADRSGLTDLHYDPATRTLYLTYGPINRLVEAWANGALRREWILPARDVRGLATIPSCGADSTTLILVESEGATWRVPGFPASCPKEG